VTGIEPLGPEATLYHNDEYIETDLDVIMGVRINDGCLSKGDSFAKARIHDLPREVHLASLLYEGTYRGERPALPELQLPVQGQHSSITPIGESVKKYIFIFS
jgi:hypothetical protein